MFRIRMTTSVGNQSMLFCEEEMTAMQAVLEMMRKGPNNYRALGYEQIQRREEVPDKARFKPSTLTTPEVFYVERERVEDRNKKWRLVAHGGIHAGAEVFASDSIKECVQYACKNGFWNDGVFQLVSGTSVKAYLNGYGHIYVLNLPLSEHEILEKHQDFIEWFNRLDPEMVVTPEKFNARMKEIKKNRDKEARHGDADEELTKALRSLGYHNGVAVYDSFEKWSA